METIKFIVVSGLAAIILMVSVGGALYVLRMRKVNFVLKAEINDRKWAEERFRSYFDLPLVGSAIYAPDKRWIEVNDKLCELFGYTRDELMAMPAKIVA